MFGTAAWAAEGNGRWLIMLDQVDAYLQQTGLHDDGVRQFKELPFHKNQWLGEFVFGSYPASAYPE
jgi:hypothetical protein